jgi:hypothetical protein
MSANPYKQGTQEWLAYEAAQGLLIAHNLYPHQIKPHYNGYGLPTAAEKELEGQGLDKTRMYSLRMKLDIKILLKAAREAGFLVIENDYDRNNLIHKIPVPDNLFGVMLKEIPYDTSKIYRISKGIYYPYEDLMQFFEDDETQRFRGHKEFFSALDMLDGPVINNHALMTFEDPFSKNHDMRRCECTEKDGLGVQIWNDLRVPELGEFHAQMFLPIEKHVKLFEQLTQRIKPLMPELVHNFAKRQQLFKKNTHMTDIKSAGCSYEV